jgi:hypothetical protein
MKKSSMHLIFNRSSTDQVDRNPNSYETEVILRTNHGKAEPWFEIWLAANFVGKIFPGKMRTKRSTAHLLISRKPAGATNPED